VTTVDPRGCLEVSASPGLEKQKNRGCETPKTLKIDLNKFLMFPKCAWVIFVKFIAKGETLMGSLSFFFQKHVGAVVSCLLCKFLEPDKPHQWHQKHSVIYINGQKMNMKPENNAVCKD